MVYWMYRKTYGRFGPGNASGVHIEKGWRARALPGKNSTEEWVLYDSR